jgi:hypothetical protein
MVMFNVGLRTPKDLGNEGKSFETSTAIGLAC